VELAITAWSLSKLAGGNKPGRPRSGARADAAAAPGEGGGAAEGWAALPCVQRLWSMLGDCLVQRCDELTETHLGSVAWSYATLDIYGAGHVLTVGRAGGSLPGRPGRGGGGAPAPPAWGRT
jgi:hypothetical protein